MRQVLVGVAHEVCENSMVDGVGFPSVLHSVFVLELQLRRIDFELLHAVSKRRVLIVASSHAYHFGIEHDSEFLDLFRRISIRIN